MSQRNKIKKISAIGGSLLLSGLGAALMFFGGPIGKISG